MDPHAHAEVDADPVKFEEAIRAFRERVPMSDEEFEQLVDAEREFGFTVAGVAQVDLVADVYEAIGRAIEDGTTLEDFQEQIGGALEESWGGEQPGRIENIFRTNVMGAYNAGRYEAATAPSVKAERPYWRLDVISDSNTTEEFCAPLAEPSVILPADHPWWQTNYPPRHYGCRDLVATLTKEQAEEEGISASPPNVPAMPGFGAAPSGAGSDWEPEKTDLPGPLADAYDDAND